MSFSPTAFLISCIITGSALASLLTADKRTYSFFGPKSGITVLPSGPASVRWPISLSNTEPSLCEMVRPFEVDIRPLESEISDANLSALSSFSSFNGADLILTTSIAPRSLSHRRLWLKDCAVPDGEKIIEVVPKDMGLPILALPISGSADQEVYACLKVNLKGRVDNISYLQSMQQYPDILTYLIEKIAKNCWSMDNRSGVEGWIQVGIDKRSSWNDSL